MEIEDHDVSPLLERMDNVVRRVTGDFHRSLCSVIDWRNRLVGVKGARGTGKTTLLRQHVRETFGGVGEAALYVSMDDLWFSTHSFMDLVDWHHRQGGKYLFVDEIHYLKTWQQCLKNIYDFYPDISVAYTGSSMLQMDYEGADLSRRQLVYDLPGLSFREYLNFELGEDFAAVKFDDILTAHREVAHEVTKKINVLKHFKDYLDHGYYPFYKEDVAGYHARLREVVKLVLEIDLPAIEEVTPATVVKARKMLSILAESVPQTPKMAQLYRELETDRNQGLKILKALARAGMLRLLSSESASLKDMSRPDKIFLDNANLMKALSPEINAGCRRETFFLNQMQATGRRVTYPPVGDFLVDETFLFEVGGRGKTFDQIKDVPNSFVAYDDVEVGRGNKIPLWLFGFL